MGNKLGRKKKNVPDEDAPSKANNVPPTAGAVDSTTNAVNSPKKDAQHEEQEQLKPSSTTHDQPSINLQGEVKPSKNDGPKGHQDESNEGEKMVSKKVEQAVAEVAAENVSPPAKNEAAQLVVQEENHAKQGEMQIQNENEQVLEQGEKEKEKSGGGEVMDGGCADGVVENEEGSKMADAPASEIAEKETSVKNEAIVDDEKKMEVKVVEVEAVEQENQQGEQGDQGDVSSGEQEEKDSNLEEEEKLVSSPPSPESAPSPGGVVAVEKEEAKNEQLMESPAVREEPKLIEKVVEEVVVSEETAEKEQVAEEVSHEVVSVPVVEDVVEQGEGDKNAVSGGGDEKKEADAVVVQQEETEKEPKKSEDSPATQKIQETAVQGDESP